MSIKSRIKLLEGKIVRPPATVFRSASDVLAGTRVGGIAREVALSRMIMKLLPYARDLGADKELRNSCHDRILELAETITKLLNSYREYRRTYDVQSNVSRLSANDQREINAALSATESLRSAKAAEHLP